MATPSTHRGPKYRLFLLLSVTWVTGGVTGQKNETGSADFFLRELVTKYGHGGSMNTTQVALLVKAVQKIAPEQGQRHNQGHGGQGGTHVGDTAVKLCSNLSSEQCLRTKCLDPATIFAYHSLPVKDGADASQVALLAPTLLYQLQNEACYVKNKPETTKPKRQKPTTAQTWGYATLAVTVINICAALGVVFYPMMQSHLYKQILMAMVGLAVGSLSASAVLVLIPEALELMDEASPMKDFYAWRMVVVLGGIYLFFTVERILESVIASRKKKTTQTTSYDMKEKGLENPAFDDGQETAVATVVSNGHSHSHSEEPPRKHAVCWAPLSTIKPVAWMVIFGDGLHNFVDGLSIGAAFSADLLAGVSLSLAVICEELPHELGDFAVLLNSGMGICQALLMNLLSGMTCYLGMAVGIQVGALENGAIYVFAMAGGMFLYISLVDMLPEMNEQAREGQKEGWCGVCVVYLLQNLGLLAGWGIILLLVLYGDKIDFGDGLGSASVGIASE